MKKRIQSKKATAPITEPTIFGTGDKDEELPPDPECVLAGTEDVMSEVGALATGIDDEDNDMPVR